MISGVIPQERPSLAAPLETAIPHDIDGYRGRDVEISREEQRVAGFDEYLMRVYEPPSSAAEAEIHPWISVYAAFYETQARGRTIHSPKNCMPGAGWEALESRIIHVQIPSTGPIPVNRYVLKRESEQVLVLYWYQGRGRVVANEYLVKWELLRDAALKRRSDEALVRIVVPIVQGESAALEAAKRTAVKIVPAVQDALPD